VDPGALDRGARKLFDACCGLRAGEHVVILTDPAQDPRVADALRRAAGAAGAEPVVVVIDRVDLPGGDLPAAAGAALLTADLIIAPTSKSVFHSPTLQAACRDGGARCVTVSEGDAGTLAGPGMQVDFRALSRAAVGLAETLDGGGTIEIRTPGGTAITASVEGRPGHTSRGQCLQPGDIIGLPTVEAYVAPVEESVNGVAVIDGSCSAGVGVTAAAPIRLTIENGMVTGIEGGAPADELAAILSRAQTPAAYQVCEIGLGLNPGCRITGRICEDEGTYGTIHLAIGDNRSFGGRNAAPLHIDMVQMRATVTLDGRPVITDGALAPELIAANPEAFGMLQAAA
jgi:leucyl aminopeptidase (aminopeptidase T)